MQHEASPQPATSVAQGQEPMKAPLPKWAYSIVNPAMVGFLRSPLHGLISKSLMVLIFDGRKSGKRYAIPVGYMQEGNRLFVFSHSGWAKNFIGGAPVAVRLRGKLVRGTAAVTDDPVVIDRMVQRMVRERGEAMTRRMGLIAAEADANGQPRTQIAKGTTFIEIQLEDAAA